MPRQENMRRAIARSSLAIACLAAGCSGDSAGERAPEQQAQSNAAAAAAASAGAPVAAAGNGTQAQAGRLIVEGDGLRLASEPGGAARAIAFGAPQAEVVASLERVRGPAEQGSNPDCPNGPVQHATWPDGLSLVFEQGRFAGWSLSERSAGAIETAAGIGVGDTRAQLAAAHAPEVQQSTLGLEFSAGDINGVLDGPSADARITEMWAGTSCVAR